MHLPLTLQAAIENEMESKSLSQLSEASSALTERYRKGSSSRNFVQSEKDRLAYILSRMPATYSVCQKVFEELSQRIPDFAPTSFLDLGSGPWTGLWAAKEAFSSLSDLIAWEYDTGFIDLAKRLGKEELASVRWQHKNLVVDGDFPSIDLALISYALNEIEEKYWEKILSSLWDKTEVLVIIEPGTPSGYERILRFRDILLQKGAFLIAPCPHKERCPLTPPDWCHFPARVERSSLHRRIKQGTLNYEDEKFSYVVFAKSSNYSNFESRIIRHPQINKGFIQLNLCHKSGEILKETITKKDKDKFKIARKSEWGDIF